MGDGFILIVWMVSVGVVLVAFLVKVGIDLNARWRRAGPEEKVGTRRFQSMFWMVLWLVLGLNLTIGNARAIFLAAPDDSLPPAAHLALIGLGLAALGAAVLAMRKRQPDHPQ